MSETKPDPRALMYRRIAEMQDRSATLGQAVRAAAEKVVEYICQSGTFSQMVRRDDLVALRDALDAEKQHYLELFGPDDYRGARP